MSAWCKKSPFSRAMYNDGSKFHEQFLKKSHPRNIPLKLIKNLTSSFRENFFRISSCPYSARSPHYLEPCLWLDKNLQTIFEKSHRNNIPVKLFQNWSSGFREEEFLRISSCLYTARSPHYLEPCLLTDQNFANIFEKGHPNNIPVKLYQNLTSSFGEEDFLRISLYPYSARSPHSPEPFYRQIKISGTIFEKGQPRNIPVKLFQNRTCSSRGEDF